MTAGVAGAVDGALLRRVGGQELGGLALAGAQASAVRAGWACAIAGRLDGMAVDADTAARLAERAASAGEAVMGDLRGEFVVVFWDSVRRRGFAAVDQLGARSLYWRRVPRGVAFATDARELLALLPSTPAPERTEVLRFLAAGTWTPEGTPFAGVRRLPGGGLLRLGERPEVARYWAPRYRGVIDAPLDDLAQAVRERLLGAVRRRLPEHGPVGLLLSGGLDSTVVGGALRALDPPDALAVRAYSGLFPANPEIDEQAGIETMARWLDAPLVRSRIAGGRPLVGVLEHVAAWRLPSTAPNVFLWTPLLQRAAGDGVRVMLDGEGGDEMFGVVPYLIADLVRRGLFGRARGVAARVPGVGGRANARQLGRLVRHYALPAALPWQALWLYRRGRAPGRYAPPYITGADARVVRAAADPWRWLRRDGPRWWAHLAHLLTDERESLDAHGFLHRRARQFGLEDAHPFLDDLDVVELALLLPPEARFDPRHDRPLTRAAMRGLMPEELRLREGKSYFTNLLGDGLRGPDAALVERLLRPSSARVGQFTDHERLVTHLLNGVPERYPRGPTWWATDLWRAASIEVWLRDLEDRGWAERELGEAGPAVDQRLGD